MALTNSQYEQIMRTYEQHRLDNEHRRRRRYADIEKKIPRIRELDDEISSLSLQQARRLLEGDASALDTLKEKIHALSKKKLALLRENGYPSDYLDLHYTCPDCQDTGYIGDRKCHCFKKAIIDLLYTQSNLQEVLDRENFDTFSMEYYSGSHIDRLTGRSSREAMEIALKSCHEFVDTFGEEFRNLLLYGDTGVGKTYLAAFDSAAYERVLFVAHREEILKQAAKAFEHVRKSDDYGFFYGKRKETGKAVIFASVASLGKAEYLSEKYFPADSFDYIVIDEYDIIGQVRRRPILKAS